MQFNRLVMKVDMRKNDISKMGTKGMSELTDPRRGEDILELKLQII